MSDEDRFNIKSTLLSADEQLALVKKAKRGNISARDRLTESLEGLVKAEATGYANWFNPFEDCCQRGRIGIYKAIDTYDPRKINPATKKPYQFSGWARWWIRQAIGNPIQKDRKNPMVSLSFKADYCPPSLLDRQPHEIGVYREHLDKALTALKGLEEVEREVVIRKYGLGGREPMGIQEIASSLGLTFGGTRTIYNRSLRRLAKSVNGNSNGKAHVPQMQE